MARRTWTKDRAVVSFSLGSTAVAGVPEGGFACARKL